MRLRFQILSPTNTGTPDYTICSQVSSNVDLTNTNLVVNIDGTDILSTTDLGTYTLPVGAITTTNGYVVSGIQRVNTYFIEMDIAMTMVETIDVSIQVSKTGYLPYNNIFKLFGYDLGNNPNSTNSNAQAITYNPDMDIYLIEELNNVVDGKQTKAFSRFTQYRKPFTDNIYIYNLSSGQGKIKYINGDNDTILSTPNGLYCKQETVDIQQIVEIYDYVNCVLTLVDNCNTLFLQAESKTYIPNFETTTKCNTNCGTNDCIVSIESANTASTFIDYTNISQFYINDGLSYSFNNQTIQYNLIDFTGNVIQELDYNFTLGSPDTYVYDFTLYNFDNYKIPEKGDYLLQVVVSSSDLYECTKNIKITSCNWYEIEQTNCNDYTAVNNSFEDLELTISKLTDNVFVEQEVKPFIKLTSLSNVLLDDGVYEFSTIRGGVKSSFIVINYCNIKNCILKSIQNILCPSDCSCVDDNAICELNSTIMLATTFFNMLNKEYNLNYLYTIIDDNKLNDLFNIDIVINKLTENCADNDCDC